MKDKVTTTVTTTLPAQEPAFISYRQLATMGEDLANALYIDSGYQILARNFRAGRFAELDLIAKDKGGLYAFVEVKTRRQEPGRTGFENPGFDAITKQKQRKIITCAQIFLARSGLVDVPCRFDVIVIEYCRLQPPLPEPVVTWVTDAF